jgi:hypothetical protein
VLHEQRSPCFGYRQSVLKVNIEDTIALTIGSGEKIDWTKVTTVRGLTKEKWIGLLKSVKAFSKKRVPIIDPMFASSTSTTQTEIK